MRPHLRLLCHRRNPSPPRLRDGRSLLKRLLLARGWERGVKKINRSLPIMVEAVQIPNRRNFVRHLRRYSGQELRIVDDGLWQRTVGVMGDKVC